MSLTEGDKAECKEIAREIVREVLAEHIHSCPHGIKLLTSKAYLIGICMGCGLAGGGVGSAIGLTLAKIMTNLP